MTDKIEVVPISMDHAAATFRWASDPRVRAGMGLRNDASEARTQEWIARCIADDGIRGYALLVDGRHVGNATLDTLDTYLKSARYAFYIGEPAALGRGIGSQGMAASLKTMFRRSDLNKIWCVVHEQNHRSIGACLNAGFKFEGILRDEYIVAGKYLAAVRLGALRSDIKLSLDS